eukprot:TRINITY_DN3223_c0_g3_i3.p1 TRINITY_DN3223_c0_g3~~TRINITY_DN3223_c0_g3_i3.p1  ORF type:complete len:267 (-),score=104.62 TRINITY_DN3223_c0_g3_i3:3-803(-)
MGYLFTKKLEMATKAVAQQEAKQASEATQETEPAEKEKHQLQKHMEQLAKIQEALAKGDTGPRIRLNTNIGTTAKLGPMEKLDEQRKELEAIAKFVTESCIQTLINEVAAGEVPFPCDSRGLADLFHQNGVNMRYIGRVHKILGDKEVSPLKLLLERVAIARSLKHIFNEAMSEVPETYLSETITHLLNCVFAPSHLIAALNEGTVSHPLVAKPSDSTKEVAQKAEQPQQPQQPQQQQSTKQEAKEKAPTQGSGQNEVKELSLIHI